MLQSKSDHANICCVEIGSTESTAIISFIETAAKKANDEIKRKSRECELTKDVTLKIFLTFADTKPIGLGEPTVRSKSSSGSLEREKITYTDTSSSAPIHLSAVTSPEGTAGSTIGSFQLLPTLTDFSVDKMDPKLPCFVMPLGRNHVFSGQAEVLEQLEKYLSPMSDDYSASDESETGSHLRMFALCGPGGMGKSQVAAEFVYRSNELFDAIIWISADDPVKLARSFDQAAVALGLVEAESMESRDHTLTRDAVLGWLADPITSYRQRENAQFNEATWLLVFDNVEDLDMLDEHWPAYGSGSILITSRDPLVKSYGYSPRRGLSMPPLDTSEGERLLIKLTGRRKLSSEKRESVTAIAEILGDLPLAIVQMAGVITRQDLTFSEFLLRYQEESAHAGLFNLKLGPSKARAGYEYTIASVWALDYLEEGSQALLQAMSLLDLDSIPEYILEENPAASTWSGYLLTNAEYQNARTELI